MVACVDSGLRLQLFDAHRQRKCMQSYVVLFVVLHSAFLEGEAVDAASVVHAIVLAVSLLVKKHIEAL